MNSTGNFEIINSAYTGNIFTLDDSGNITNVNSITSKNTAKVWLLYNQVTQTITNSYNVSSVTYNATGQFTVNFTNALPNANYAAVGSIIDSGGRGTYDSITFSNQSTISGNTASKIYVTTWNTNSTGTGSSVDFSGASMVIFGA